MLQPSEVAKLVHVYLKDEGYSKTCDAFESECQHIIDRTDLPYCKIGKVGTNLTSILNDFLIIKETDTELERSEASSVLQSLWKQLDTLIAQLKYASMRGNSQSSRRSIFSQSVRSKKAALSRESAIYKMKSMEFKENRTGKSTSNSFMQYSLGCSEPAQVNYVPVTPVSKLISAQDSVLLEVGNSRRGNHTHPALTPARVNSSVASDQVSFIPPTPGAFLLQQPTIALNLASSSDVMRNNPVEPVTDAHAVSVGSNQTSNNSCVTPLRANNQTGSAAVTSFDTQHINTVSGILPTTGTCLVPLQSSIPAVLSSSESALNFTHTNNAAQMSQVQAFSNQTVTVTSSTASVTMVTDTGRQPLVNSNTSPPVTASVNMEMPVNQNSSVSPNIHSLSTSNTSLHQQVQNSIPNQKSLEQDCETSFVEAGCTFEVVEEGQSESSVTKQQGENNMLDTEALNKGTLGCFRSKQVESMVFSQPDLTSPQKGGLDLEDFSLTETQLRSPRRKCPQPKRRSAATESPGKFADGTQKSSNKGDVISGMPESGSAAVPAILETLLGTPSLQEKLAENINRVVARHDGPDTSGKDVEENVPQQTDESQTADIPVDDILALMQADPAFEALFAPDATENREDSDAVTDKTDVHAELQCTCSLPAEMSSPSDSQSTLSNSATLVTDALLLLSHSPQNERSQPESCCTFGDDKTELVLTTSEMSLDQESAISTSLTVDDSGLMVSSTMSDPCVVREVNATQRVEPGKTRKTKKSISSRPLTPLKSHVRCLNFGESATGKPYCKKKSRHKSQKVSTVVSNTGNSNLVEAAIPLNNQQSNNSGPSQQDRVISHDTPPGFSDGTNLHLLTVTSLSHESPQLTCVSSVQSGCTGPVQGESGSQIAFDVNPLQATVQGTQIVAPLHGGEQVTKTHNMSNPAAFPATVPENTNAMTIHPHRTPDMAPIQDAQNTALDVCPTQIQTQGNPNALHSVSTNFHHTPSACRIRAAPQDIQGAPIFHMCISSQDPQTASTKTFISSSQPATHSTEVVSQVFQPIMTTTTQHSTMQTVNNCFNSQPTTIMVSNASTASPAVGSRSESTNKNGGMLRALQLGAEQDAKSLFGTNKSLGMFSASEYIIHLSRQYALKEGKTAGSEKHSSPQLGHHETHNVGSVSKSDPTSRSSAPFVAESCIPISISQQMAKTQQRQSSVPFTPITLPPVTCLTSLVTQLSSNVTQNARCAQPTSGDGTGAINHSFSLTSTAKDERQHFRTSGQTSNLVTAGSSVGESMVSKETVSSSDSGPCVNITSSALRYPLKHIQSDSSNVAIVTSNSDAEPLNILSVSQEQNKDLQSSNVASHHQIAVTSSERESDRARKIQSPVNMAADSPASSYCSEVSVPTPDGSEGKPSKGPGKRSQSATPENNKKKKLKHHRTSKKLKKKPSTDIPRNLENLDVDKFLSKLHYIEK